MNKKADILGEEGLKIIMAVLGIIILFALAFSLYGIFLNKTATEQAKTNLDVIISKIGALNTKESSNYLITSPKDWGIYIFYKGESSPKNCLSSNCICICSEFSTSKNTVIDSCDSSGACGKLKYPAFIFPNTGVNYIRLQNLPKEIHIENTDGLIYISTPGAAG